MKKNHSYLKNVLREIRSSFGRFFSIFAIVALGTGFFAGLVATAPDMLDSVDAYYDRSHMSDLEILSTLGLTDADVEAISEIDGIAEVSPHLQHGCSDEFPRQPHPCCKTAQPAEGRRNMAQSCYAS